MYSSSEELEDAAGRSVVAVGVAVRISVGTSVERPMSGESTSLFKFKAMVTGVAGRSVEAVEVMLVVDSRLINRAKGSAAAKATARIKATIVAIRILLALREDQGRMYMLEEQNITSKWILFGCGGGAI